MRGVTLLFLILAGGCIVPSAGQTSGNSPPVALTLNYTMGTITTFQFNLCSASTTVDGKVARWRGYDAYLCTFIPNNTAPDDSVTRALEGLRTWSIEMHENSGIDSTFSDLLDNWFGKWKGMVVSILVSSMSLFCPVALCGCCCIPCIRSLCNRI